MSLVLPHTNYSLLSLRLLLLSALISLFICSCKQAVKPELDGSLHIELENFKKSSDGVVKLDSHVQLSPENFIVLDVPILVSGRYKIAVLGQSQSGSIWLEDYIHNTDDRTYNITGDISFGNSYDFQTEYKFGSPMAKGNHQIKIHAKQDTVMLDWIKFTPMIIHDSTYQVVEQHMDGTKWSLVWSDEFNDPGLPDTNKWSYNVGDWGWGNNELQYYTHSDAQNARIEDGNLIIEARQINEQKWSSARLTTQGKFGFKYGKIEFRAKVPHQRGTWAAGWLLGSAYVDELSWPYCGEIDVLECVGFEIDDSTYTGLNHATCHTRKYYFKQGNQIGSDTTLTHMTDSFHTYAVEWYPDVIYGLVNGKRYYVYDKNKDEHEWPFDKPQDIIVNLAIGGGWGGAKGISPKLKSAQYIIDYIRVYDLK